MSHGHRQSQQKFGHLVFPDHNGLVNSDTSRKEVQPIPTPESSKPMPGEIRVAHSKESDAAIPRFVLVISAVNDEVSLVTLIAGPGDFEADCLTHRDVVVRADESGLDYEVVLETDICVPVWNSQLYEPVGNLADSMRFLLATQPDLSGLEAWRLGEQPLPIALRNLDLRRLWKEKELSEANALSGPCYTWLVGC